MKLNRLILLSIAILLSLNINGQRSLEADTSFFSFELIPSRNLTSSGDTANTVILVLDSADITKYSKIIMTGDFIREIKTNSTDLRSDSRIEQRANKYRINMQEWSCRDKWTVTGVKVDGSQDQLIALNQMEIGRPKVKTFRPETTDVEIYNGPRINEEEEESIIEKQN